MNAYIVVNSTKTPNLSIHIHISERKARKQESKQTSKQEVWIDDAMEGNKWEDKIENK